MSWLAAARKRVLEMLASSASALARPSSALSRVSSVVRSRTRTLQRRVGALQRFGRLDARRDVGEGGDDAAVRHAVGAHLDHEAALGEALEERLAVGDVAREPLAHQRLDRARRRARPARRCSAGFRRGRRRCGSAPAAGRGFRRTAGSSRPAAGPCRTPRCPGARGRARSAGFRGCSGSPRWRRRAA